MAAKKACQHPTLVPLEIHYAKVTYPNGYKEASYYDYGTNIMGANISRVYSYLCPKCLAEIKSPRREK